LRIILSLLKPQAREVIYIPEKAKPLSAAKPKIGYLQESASLYPFLTVREIFLLAARGAGLSRSQLRAGSCSAEKLVSPSISPEESRLSPKHGTKSSFWRGHRRSARPPIFDEPYSGLDPLIMHEIRNLILNLKPRRDYFSVFSSTA
jgi:ABC-type multidrug transport system ATPase subunit